MIKFKALRIKKLKLWLISFTVLGVAVYPIILKPMIDPSEYKEIQKISRQGIDQNKIQPGNMKVWRDPFEK